MTVHIPIWLLWVVGVPLGIAELFFAWIGPSESLSMWYAAADERGQSTSELRTELNQ